MRPCRVPEGRALRILTGAALPDGVDTVILEEDTTVKEGHIGRALRSSGSAQKGSFWTERITSRTNSVFCQ